MDNLMVLIIDRLIMGNWSFCPSTALNHILWIIQGIIHINIITILSLLLMFDDANIKNTSKHRELIKS